MKKLQKNKIYLIEWIDTYSYGGWYTEDEIDELTRDETTKTIGFFIKETDFFIILAMSLEGSKDFAPYGNIKWIPKGCIVNIKKIK
jgi:hypothetical protein